MAIFPWAIAETIVMHMSDPRDIVAFAQSCSDARKAVNDSTAERIMRLLDESNPASSVIVTAARAAASRRSLNLFLKVFEIIGLDNLWLGDAALVSLQRGFVDVFTWACERRPGFVDCIDYHDLRRAAAAGRVGWSVENILREELMLAIKCSRRQHVAMLVVQPLPGDLLADAHSYAREICSEKERGVDDIRTRIKSIPDYHAHDLSMARLIVDMLKA
jgi:hypothetical protein